MAKKSSSKSKISSFFVGAQGFPYSPKNTDFESTTLAHLRASGGPSPFDIQSHVSAKTVTGHALVTATGIARMYYMSIFGFPAVTIAVAEGIEWLVDYSKHPETISVFQQSSQYVFNHLNQVHGRIKFCIINDVLQPVIDLTEWDFMELSKNASKKK